MLAAADSIGVDSPLEESELILTAWQTPVSVQALIGWLQVQGCRFKSWIFFFHLIFKHALCSKVKGFRPHGLLVYRLCLPPDTPIIYLKLYLELSSLSEEAELDFINVFKTFLELITKLVRKKLSFQN